MKKIPVKTSGNTTIYVEVEENKTYSIDEY
jgi:hypothetical protein